MDASSSRPMPATVGQRPVQPAAVAAALGVLGASGCAVSTQIAARLGFSPDLGHPLLGHVYDPLAWLRWSWMAYDPIRGFDYIHHHGYYVAALYDALSVVRPEGAAALVAAFIAYAGVTAASAPAEKEKIKAIVDSAHFADVAEIRAKTTLLSANCGPIVGMVETEPRKSTFFGLVTLKPAKWEHLRSGDSQTGTNIIGISGAGKTPDYIRQLLLNPQVHPQAESWSEVKRRDHPHGYEPNLVVFDLKGSLFAATSGYQKNELHKNVFVFSPYSRDYALSKYNPLHFIRLTEPEEFDDCRTAAIDIVDESGGLKGGSPTDDYWKKVALDFGGAIVATVGYIALSENNPAKFSHAGVIDYVSLFSTPDALIADMLEREHDPWSVLGWVDANGQPTKKQDWIVKATTRLQARAEEEKSGIFGSFVSYVGVYSGPILREHISSTTFDLKALANDRERASTLYIVMPDSDLERIRPFFRIMVKDMFRRLMTGTETIDGRELPGNLRMTRFVLDEVRALNRLEPLAMTSGFMRGHKVIVDTAWQSRAQLLECYGENETLSGNLGTHMYYQTIPGVDAKYLSEQCGQTSYVLQHRNKSGKRLAPIMGQLAEQNQVQTRKNLTEYEACNLGKDRKILFVDGAIIRANQCRYYRYPEVDRRARLARVERPDVSITCAPFIAGIRGHRGDAKLAKLTSPSPDRWAADRDKADEIDGGFRVRRWQAKHDETGDWRFYAQLWLPDAVAPVIDHTNPFANRAEREAKIMEVVTAYEDKAPDDREVVVVPHNEDPADSVRAAFDIE
jgi:type IV secretory pathway TraG/TraD family ATPase VirD4